MLLLSYREQESCYMAVLGSTVVEKKHNERVNIWLLYNCRNLQLSKYPPDLLQLMRSNSGWCFEILWTLPTKTLSFLNIELHTYLLRWKNWNSLPEQLLSSSNSIIHTDTYVGLLSGKDHCIASSMGGVFRNYLKGNKTIYCSLCMSWDKLSEYSTLNPG